MEPEVVVVGSANVDLVLPVQRIPRPGETVLDPQCGAGTVLVEALRSGRHAVGITEMPRWWPVARANATAAKRDGATTDGMVLDGPLDRATARLSGLTGCVGLVPPGAGCAPT